MANPAGTNGYSRLVERPRIASKLLYIRKAIFPLVEAEPPLRVLVVGTVITRLTPVHRNVELSVPLQQRIHRLAEYIGASSWARIVAWYFVWLTGTGCLLQDFSEIAAKHHAASSLLRLLR